MADLAVLAWGLGILPVAAILLFAVRPTIAANRGIAWGFLAGVVAFLGVSHAMAAVLINHSLLGDAATASVIAFGGFLVGAGVAWALLETSLIRTEPTRILGAAAAFLALHSAGDGLVLGTDFVAGLTPIIRLDVITVSGTILHRFIEGALVVVPATAAMWKPRSTLVPLLASFTSIPAAYAPSWIFAIAEPVGRGTTVLSISTFVAAAEAAFALMLLARVFLPVASADRDHRWLAWTVIGFVGISLLHFLIE